jgi:hypothetical protein
MSGSLSSVMPGKTPTSVGTITSSTGASWVFFFFFRFFWFIFDCFLACSF